MAKHRAPLCVLRRRGQWSCISALGCRSGSLVRDSMHKLYREGSRTSHPPGGVPSRLGSEVCWRALAHEFLQKERPKGPRAGRHGGRWSCSRLRRSTELLNEASDGKSPHTFARAHCWPKSSQTTSTASQLHISFLQRFCQGQRSIKKSSRAWLKKWDDSFC